MGPEKFRDLLLLALLLAPVALRVFVAIVVFYGGRESRSLMSVHEHTLAESLLFPKVPDTSLFFENYGVILNQ